MTFGISEKEVAVMLQTNPAKLMYLDDKTPRAEDSWHTRGQSRMSSQPRPAA